MKSINIKNFGIIKSANIKLDGLTIISGVNDSGKSTIGKLIFSIIKAINKLNEYTEYEKENNVLKEIKNLYSLLRDKPELKSINHKFYPPDFIKELTKYIENPDFINSEKDEFNLMFLEREKLLKQQNLYSNSIDEILKNIKEFVLAENQDEEIIKNFLTKYLHSEFYFQISPKSKEIQTIVEYKESEEDFLTFTAENDIINSLNYFEPSFFENATLIETPLLLQIFELIKSADILGETDTLSIRPKTHFHIKDLIDKVKNAEYFHENNADELTINLLKQINTIISGEFYFNPQKDNFYFTKKGVGNVEAINTATGIKSFGIVQLLIKSNFINPKNIIIIDEPENHLHPKWQIEYAKVIVELVKNDITVLISSHSPYMIQALRHYSNENKIEKKTNFYLAEIKENEDNFAEIIEANNNLNEIFSKLAQPLKDLVWL